MDDMDDKCSQPSAPSYVGDPYLRSRSFSRLGRVKEDDSLMLSDCNNLDGILQQYTDAEMTVALQYIEVRVEALQQGR
jgi:hypothetical protein